MIDISLQLATGIDIPIPELDIMLHQPTIEEISYMGETDFFSALGFFTIKKEILKEKIGINNLENFSNYEIFLELVNNKEIEEKKELVLSFLSLIIIGRTVKITKNGIMLFKKDSEIITVEKENFELLQEIVKEIFCIKEKEKNELNYNPKGKKAKEIAEKLLKGREKVSKLKGEDRGSLLGRYCSILAIGLKIDLKIIIKYTVYQIYDLLERFKLYTEYDLDIKVRLAGGQPEGSPIDWMKNIHS